MIRSRFIIVVNVVFVFTVITCYWLPRSSSGLFGCGLWGPVLPWKGCLKLSIADKGVPTPLAFRKREKSSVRKLYIYGYIFLKVLVLQDTLCGGSTNRSHNNMFDAGWSCISSGSPIYLVENGGSWSPVYTKLRVKVLHNIFVDRKITLYKFRPYNVTDSQISDMHLFKKIIYWLII